MDCIKKLLFCVAMLFVLSACKKETKPQTSVLSAKIDGIPWSTNNVSYANSVNFSQQHIFRIYGNHDKEQLQISLLNYIGPKTYKLDQSGEAMGMYTVDVVSSSEKVHFEAVSGEFTVNRDTGDYLEGTFGFTVKNINTGVNKTITEGTFRIKL